MEDEPHAGRPSTSKTDDNVERVIVHKEFVPPGQTVNQTFCREVLERLRKRVARVRPGIARTWMLHHYNAPCQTAVSINEFLAEKKHSCGSSAPLFAGSQSL